MMLIEQMRKGLPGSSAWNHDAQQRLLEPDVIQNARPCFHRSNQYRLSNLLCKWYPAKGLMFLKHILECWMEIVCWMIFLGAENLTEWQAATAQPTNSCSENWSDWSKGNSLAGSTRKCKTLLLHKYQVAYTRKCDMCCAIWSFN